MAYNYSKQMARDIMNYIDENFDRDDFIELLEDAAGDVDDATESLIEKLNDDLWIEDSVTGNGSGSYFFNSYRAESAIAHNWDLISDMIKEFDCPDILSKGPEAVDVSIRCYLLNSVLWSLKNYIIDRFNQYVELTD